MTQNFEPFTPEMFRQQTGLQAADNEAIYIRWVNTQINYANYQSMRDMAHSLKDILERLNDPSMVTDGRYPFTK
jgi:hypothetical protein